MLMKRIRNPARLDAKLLSNTVLWTPDDPALHSFVDDFQLRLLGQRKAHFGLCVVNFMAAFADFSNLFLPGIHTVRIDATRGSTPALVWPLTPHDSSPGW